MLDFAPVWSQTQKISALTGSLSVHDLRDLTNEMIDRMQQLIAACEDADIVFTPNDPNANDPGASEEERNVGWTLGHVIVHATASAEENAFLAAELARGIEFHGRSRYEVPWEQITTVKQSQHRLEESRRMRLASLETWPDEPHFEIKRPLEFLQDELDARAQFVLGLAHDDGHLAQIAEIVRQAQAARQG